MKRELLARSSGVATRQRVFRMPDGLEIDEVDHYEVRRSRVLYEDVILVTYHRSRGVLLLVSTGVLALLLAGIAYLIGREESIGGWIFLSVTTAPLLVVFILRLLLGIDEINVYSRRSNAKLRFQFRKKRAREIFQGILGSVRRRQDAMGRAAGARGTISSDETLLPTDT